MSGDHPYPALAALAEFALSLPEAWADTPWGDQVVKRLDAETDRPPSPPPS